MEIAFFTLLSTSLAAYSDNYKCGKLNSDLMCDPQGKYGPCCSKDGYCGNTTDYCSVSSGCQSGCVDLPPLSETAPAGCGDGFCDGRTETCSNCPSDCKCNLEYLDKCLTPGHIALTFDDGPDQFAPNLLSTANELDIKITLFVIGKKLNSTTYQEYLKEYYKAGHTIASHTFTHPYLTKLTEAEIRDEMTKTDDAIFDLIGVRPIYMRNPYADSDKRTMALLDSMGYKSIFTSLDTEDTIYGDSDPAKILANVVKGLQADPSVTPYVITQHETFNASINHLPAIVKEIQERNYTIVDISTCFGTESPYRSDKCGDKSCTGYIEDCATCPLDCGSCPAV